ncbi:hypothetical protein GGS23DRAFT_595161 [Durotheca rogersii]|uniref:uncharacterized protein n=1 Tax=Durotheca rogersii TaxID=419775 RepID=UPI00221E4C8E|nr:uncharacterized protein GGS23DRAFT_595161 [Durotheca rogersii]KAI5865645.1 hypothetical protein GGS23DRAFT_595161 [Durotheca rogersii]
MATYQNFQKHVTSLLTPFPSRGSSGLGGATEDVYLNLCVTKGSAYRKSQMRAKYPSIINTLDEAQHRRKRKFTLKT